MPSARKALGEIIDGLEVHRTDLEADRRAALVQAVLDALNVDLLRYAASLCEEANALDARDELDAAADALAALREAQTNG